MVGNPSALIDKSFLQSLTLDEAFWFFTYFDGVLTPVLIAEFIGDLEKSYRDGRDPAKMVSSMARKLSRTPAKLLNVSHAELGSANLLGEHIKMNMRPTVYGARAKTQDGRVVEVADSMAFLEMLQAWDEGLYSPDEFRRSRVWREYTTQFNPAALRDITNDLPPPKELQDINLETVRSLQASDILKKESGLKNLKWAFAEFNIPREGRKKIKNRWMKTGKPSLYDFAPYAAFTVLAIRTHMFASALDLTGTKQKSSDVVDMEYLLYLPFCRFFVSNDKFQLNFFEVLGEEGQLGVKGSDMKSSLADFVSHFGGSPLSRPLQLNRSQLSSPPKQLFNYATGLWDLACPGWR